MSDKSYTVYRIERKRRLWRIAALVAVLLLGGLAGGGAWLARAETGNLPPGVVIAGVDVGARPAAEARALLGREAAKVLARPITLLYEGGQLETSGAEIGAEAQIDEALERARGSRGTFSRLQARLGLADPIELELSFVVDPARLDEALDRVERKLERKPVSADVELVDGQVVLKPSRAGRELDLEAAAEALMSLPSTVELTLREIPPAVSDETAEQAKATGGELLTDPPVIAYRKRRYELPAGLVREALGFERGAGTIEVTLDPKPFEKPLRRAFRSYEREPLDASFKARGKRVAIVPSRQGKVVAVERVVADLLARAAKPEVKLRFDRVDPELTTEKAEAYKITELVSEFTTPYQCCPPRVTNIKLAAEILDGYVVKPNARFSLNQALGPRTSERGFVLAPMIQAGKLVDAIGGGVSQVATTFYNAAFFAGLELIEHTPHEFYISRYPMGREATVSWGGPELVFRNDWPAAILVKVVAADTSITVRFYSSKLGRRVETETFAPYAYTAAQTIRVLNRSLPPGTEEVVQSGGISGFTVEYTRKVYRGKKPLRDERWKVRYRPENTIVEYGPKPKKPPKEKPDGEGGGQGGQDGGGESPPPAEEPPEPGTTEPPPPPS